MADKKEASGLDIWDIALPVGGAVIGRAGGRILRRRSKTGRANAKKVSEAEAKDTAASKAFDDEWNAADRKLRDAAQGKVKLTEAEELRLRRITSNYDTEIPGTNSDALEASRKSMFDKWDARSAANRYVRTGGRAGMLVGGAAGYGANKTRRK